MRNARRKPQSLCWPDEDVQRRSARLARHSQGQLGKSTPGRVARLAQRTGLGCGRRLARRTLA
ncbi:hypothetical protein AAV94_05580 [Lampropedia cohaerens]|uniref:Uncharacterized protein n=1 Tax=Lampropedia cohaerens TaxID=1610491 RepID=A0A0U1Q0J5_9BURK|nr:hypothetical protein AAV94_05580 [Lampropedia cohaerens]